MDSFVLYSNEKGLKVSGLNRIVFSGGRKQRLGLHLNGHSGVYRGKWTERARVGNRVPKRLICRCMR